MYVRSSTVTKIIEDPDVVPGHSVICVAIIVLDMYRSIFFVVYCGDDVIIVSRCSPVIIVPLAGDFHADPERTVFDDNKFYVDGFCSSSVRQI